jgi:hypothetical protein
VGATLRSDRPGAAGRDRGRRLRSRGLNPHEPPVLAGPVFGDRDHC